MSVQAAEIRLLLSAVDPATAPVSGGAKVEFDYHERPASGTGASQWDLIAAQTYTIAASGTEALDLEAFPGPFGSNVDFAEVDVLVVSHDTGSAASSVDMTPNATNGFTAIQQDPSDLTRIYPGGWSAHKAGTAGYAVGSAAHLDIVNNDGSNAATVSVYLYGRSA